ncbi:MAG: hypothetical protein ACI920_002948, partial [Saprospiraceae bacterium]
TRQCGALPVFFASIGHKIADFDFRQSVFIKSIETFISFYVSKKCLVNFRNKRKGKNLPTAKKIILI